MPSASDVDALVVGAGPTGLTLACELARHGISFRNRSQPADRARLFGYLERIFER
jgi:cation diffusion facilitator CzcD-associated flavoprotein CzcO